MQKNYVSTAPSKSFGEEVFRRFMLCLFAILCWQCTNFIVEPVAQGHVQLVLLTLFDISAIVITARLFGDNSVTRDINEINTYSVLFHIIYLPFYFGGVQAIYHNTAIKGLLLLVVVRLVFFGPRTADGDFQGMPVFGLLGHARQYFEKWQKNHPGQLFQYWQHLFFFGTAAPLWFVMTRSNDLFVTALIAALMVFIFFMADYLQRHLAQLRHTITTQQARLAELEARQELSITDTTLRATPREVAKLMLDSYKATHPSMQNLTPVLAIYMERNFPEEAIFGPHSMSARKAKAVRQLAELLFLAKEMQNSTTQLGQIFDDFDRLTYNFDESLRFDMDNQGLVAFMAYVAGLGRLNVPDTTFVLACDVLTTAWLRLLLTEDPKGYLSKFPDLEQLTFSFVKDHMPFDSRIEN